MSRYRSDTLRERALDKVCLTLVDRLKEVARVADANTSHADIAASVVSVFASMPHGTELQRSTLADAFQRLDEKPSWYGDYRFTQPWHSCLRITRNSNEFGPKLFALWNDDKPTTQPRSPS